MRLAVPSLIKRGNIYYFRCRIPQEYCAGKTKEIKISLQTSDLKTAATACKLAVDKFKSLIETGACEMLPFAEIRKIMDDFIRETLEGQSRHIAGFGPICNDTRHDSAGFMLRLCNQAEQGLENNNLDVLDARNQAASLLGGIPHDPEDLALAAREFLNSMLYLGRIQRERLLNARHSVEFSKEDYARVLGRDYPSARQVVDTEAYQKLGDLVSQYLAAPTHKWCIKMADDVRNTLELLCEHFKPETDIRALNRRAMLQFRDEILMAIPSRRNVLPKYKGKTLAQLLACKGAVKLSRRTVNHNIARLSGFFTWCTDRMYLESNPVSNIQLKITGRASAERSIYSKDDLIKIFTHLRQDRLKAWAPFKLWITLIMFYSGCRQNEICQLYTSDIILVDNIPCFNLAENEETGARLKTEQSIRVVPIHPVLAQLGFFEYVLTCMGRGKIRKPVQLWPHLRYSPKEGYARRYRTFFEDFNRKFITDEKGKTCHSLRHTFIDNLKQQEVPEYIVSAIAGHSGGDIKITYNRYGKTLNVKVKMDTMCKFNPGIDIFAILGKRPLPGDVIDKQLSKIFP